MYRLSQNVFILCFEQIWANFLPDSSGCRYHFLIFLLYIQIRRKPAVYTFNKYISICTEIITTKEWKAVKCIETEKGYNQTALTTKYYKHEFFQNLESTLVNPTINFTSSQFFVYEKAVSNLIRLNGNKACFMFFLLNLQHVHYLKKQKILTWSRSFSTYAKLCVRIKWMTSI